MEPAAPIPIDTITVRPTSAVDAEALSTIWLETYETLGQLDARIQVRPDGAERWAEALREALLRPETVAFTAHRRGQAVGALLGAIHPNRPGLYPDQIGVIDELIVDSHGHGGGHGRLLLDAASARFIAAGLTRVEIRVPTQNVIAQAFWRANGVRQWYDLVWLRLSG